MDERDERDEGTLNDLECFPGATPTAPATPDAPLPSGGLQEGKVAFGAEAASDAAPDRAAEADSAADAPSLADAAGADRSAASGGDAAPAGQPVRAAGEPAVSPVHSEPEVNPWNGPVSPSYGETSPVAAAPRRGVNGAVVAVVAVVVVALAVVFALVGPHLLAPAEDDPADEVLVENIDPLDHDVPDPDLPEGLSEEDIEDLLTGGSVDPATLDGAERAVYDIADARLAALAAADSVEMDLIGSLVSEGFAHQMEVFTLADCGVDPTEYARVMVEGLTYTIDSVYVGQAGDSALVHATVTCRDIYAVIDEFNAMMDAYTSSDEFQLATMEEDAERVGIMLMEAARRAPLNDGYAMDIVLRAEGDGWVVDENAWTSELDYLFDVE